VQTVNAAIGSVEDCDAAFFADAGPDLPGLVSALSRPACPERPPS
jgi:hypothetical protein